MTQFLPSMAAAGSRTKKPSASSSKAADLLHKDGQSSYVTFASFSSPSGGAAASGTAAAVPRDGSASPLPIGIAGSGQSADDESGIDAELLVVLKKLSKRDVTTKVKGLDELKEMVQAKRVDDVVHALARWSKIYTKLTLDNDRRVRDGAQQALGAIVFKVQRKIAPHLKVLMPSWLISRFDQSRDVARNATAAFELAFPNSAKEKAAFVHCSVEILATLADFIVTQTPDTIGDVKVFSKEELETIYERIVSASLSALAHVVGVLAIKDDTPEIATTLSWDVLLEPKKLWGFYKHSSAQIRKSLYHFLAVFARHQPAALLAPYLASIFPILFSFGERDISALADLWEAILLITKEHPAVWTQKDPRKALVPPLFSFLKNGTFGSARLSYPSLLPMVAAMPAQIVGTSESTFWEPLFSALTDGASKSEQFGGLENSKAFLEAYRDLWQLLLSHTMDPIPLQGRLDLAVSQLSWLASAILKENKLAPRAVATTVAQLLDHALGRAELMPVFEKSADELDAMCSDVVADVATTNQATLSKLDSLLAIMREASSPALSQFAKDLSVRQFSAAATVCVHRPEAAMQPRLVFCKQLLSSPSFLASCPWEPISSLFNEALLPRSVSSGILSDYLSMIAEALKHPNLVEAAVVVVSDVALGNSTTLATKLAFISAMQGTSAPWPSLDAAVQSVWAAYYNATTSDASFVPFISKVIVPATTAATMVVSGNLRATILRDLFDGVKLHKQRALEVVKACLVENTAILALFSSSSTNILAEVCHQLALGESRTLALLTNIWSLSRAAIPSISPDWISNFAAYLTTYTAADQPSLKSAALVKLAMVELVAKDLGMGQDLLKLLLPALAQNALVSSTAQQSSEEALRSSFHGFGLLPGVTFPAFEASLIPSVDLLRASSATTNTSQDVVAAFSLGIFVQYGKQVLCACDSSAALLETSAKIVQQLVLYLIGHGISSTFHAHDIVELVQLPTAVSGNPDGIELVRLLWQSLLSDLPSFTLDFLLPAFDSAPSTAPSLASLPVALRLAFLIAQEATTALRAAKPTAASFSASTVLAQVVLHSTIEAVASASSGDLSSLESVLNSASKVPLEAKASAASAWTGPLSLSSNDQARQFAASSLKHLLAMPNEHVFGTSGANRIEGWRRLVMLNSSLAVLPSGPEVMDALRAVYGTNTGEHLRGRERAVQAEAAAVLAKTVASLPMPYWLQERSRWDFLVARLTVWLDIDIQKTGLTVETALLCFNAFKVLQEIGALFREEQEAAGGPTATLPMAVASLVRDWNMQKNVLFRPVFDLFLKNPELRDFPAGLRLLKPVCKLVQDCPEQLVFPNADSLSLSTTAFLDYLCCCNSMVQRGAFGLLQRAVQIEAQTLSLAEESMPAAVPVEPEEDGGPQVVDPVVLLGPLLSKLLETVLRVRQLDVAESISEHADADADATTTTGAHHYLLAYLLGWLLVMDHLDAENTRLRLMHLSYLQSMPSHPLEELLLVLIELLGLHDDSDVYLPRQPLYRVPLNAWDSNESLHQSYAQLAAHVFWRLLRSMPAFVRDWWSDSSDRKLKLTMEKYVEAHFAPSIVAHHVAGVTSSAAGNTFDNMTIKAGANSKQVTAVYKIEEMSIEMCIKFPLSFPLRPVVVEGGNRVGVTESQWRRWLLSMTTVIASQNGTIIEALQMWKQDADKMFEGIEECAICYCVISTVDRSLPKSACKTCKHKFHSSCLYKWFKSSSQSSCPLCRNLF